jgi:hypothetical protein
MTKTAAISANTADRRWPYWPIVPIYPYGQRRTLRRELVPDWIWVFEQVQGIFYVVVPIRMTVVRLEAGGLLVYAPVAPTGECLGLLRELCDRFGDVRYIILPTISGIEHKVFIGPFARRFPAATVFVAPGQWSFPVNLPLSWLGCPWGRTEILPPERSATPFANEFDYEILGPLPLGLGKFGEVVFYHRRSRTLLATDTILSVPPDPPEVVQLDPYPLLFHAKDGAADPIRDTPSNRQKGWQRICLFALYFRPATLETIELGPAWQEAKQGSDRTRRAYFGLYPFAWKAGWRDTFASLSHNETLRVAPILQTLILNRDPVTVQRWCDRVARWPFERIIPCHFTAAIAATPHDWREAFQFLTPNPTQTLPAADLQVLRDIDRRLIDLKVTPPPA